MAKIGVQLFVENPCPTLLVGLWSYRTQTVEVDPDLVQIAHLHTHLCSATRQTRGDWRIVPISQDLCSLMTFSNTISLLPPPSGRHPLLCYSKWVTDLIRGTSSPQVPGRSSNLVHMLYELFLTTCWQRICKNIPQEYVKRFSATLLPVIGRPSR